ncbi:tRNA-splicing endonuclease subunit sen34 [Aspergillus heteromorphus CBS 117.55]|uniref:tRNA-splicing endonuclease subunit Sen34 n=1 Tax=Aspergillus heteromorphus CBS 117.55 TaxID=1448321 RepID=A0A317WGQ2_9EURO|nr:tRNA-splicing endonuclease subunit sen34 [Aspergillus heteromorphus CBS 117.55]PWY84851.1 tRNA-splicing endonuclease subunit sen34 [Aspergillus heteromorphus CBS 117.55]
MDDPSLPIPISYIAGSYFLFSIEAVTYLRREHHICGVLSGTLPQIPQQNVFLGLPLKLMPEEARLLVDKGVACIVDEVKVQKDGMRALMEDDRRKYLRELESQGEHAMRVQTSRKDEQREKALKKLEEKKARKAAKAAEQQQQSQQSQPVVADNPSKEQEKEDDPIVDLFADHAPTQHPRTQTTTTTTTAPYGTSMGVTPATSHPPLPYTPSASEHLPRPAVPSSYPLFAHLHADGYYLSPGLRFGCQYLAYPGDPLRFHSHFLGVSAEWDEELDLMDIIAGGRLGTGVKKGFLVGGRGWMRGWMRIV